MTTLQTKRFYRCYASASGTPCEFETASVDRAKDHELINHSGAQTCWTDEEKEAYPLLFEAGPDAWKL